MTNFISLSGQAASGKDTVADYLVSEYGFVKVAQADPIKRICRDLYGFSDTQLWGPSELRNAPDVRYLHQTFDRHAWKSPNDGIDWRCDQCGIPSYEARQREHVGGPECRVYLSPRIALQRIGTEGGRHSYANTWVNLAIGTARSLLKAEAFLDYTGPRGLFPMDKARPVTGVVITDCRFLNEVDAFTAEGARLWRIRRPVANSLSSVSSMHASEREQQSIPDSRFHAVLHNDADLPALFRQVDSLMRMSP